MRLELDETAEALLRELLDSAYRELKGEIAHTDNSTFKRQLRDRERTLTELLDKLGGPLPDRD